MSGGEFKKDISVLVVEDRVSDLAMVQDALLAGGGQGFAVYNVQTLEEAVACVDKRHFDIILLELNLADSDGLATVEHLSSFTAIPIIVLTDKDDESLALGAIQRGAQEFLIKRRANASMLRRVLRYAVERSGLQRQLAQEIARRERERDREMAYFTGYSLGRGVPVSQAIYCLEPLEDCSPAIFWEQVATYGRLLDRALENQAYRTSQDISGEMSGIVDSLVFVNAGPRDVIRIHTEALTSRTQTGNRKRIQGYMEEGRLMVLELMGLLAARYRTLARGRPRIAAAEIERGGK